jgi:hypothetical protein
MIVGRKCKIPCRSSYYALSPLGIGSDYMHKFLLAHACWFIRFPKVRADRLNHGPMMKLGPFTYLSQERPQDADLFDVREDLPNFL